jgi:hypothetical protein
MEGSEYLRPLRLREASHQPAANRSKRGGSSTTPHPHGCVPAIQRGASRIYLLCKMRHLDLSRPIHQWRIGSPFISSFRSKQSGKLAAKAPVYSSISGAPPRPTVISEMFHKLVSSPAQAVTARVMPSCACHRRCRFPIVTRLSRCRESIDPGMLPVHPRFFLGRIESESIAFDLIIAGDLLQAVSQRSTHLATRLSTDSMP